MNKSESCVLSIINKRFVTKRFWFVTGSLIYVNKK